MSESEHNEQHQNLLERAPRVINVGLQAFGEAVRRQGIEIVQVNWHPPRIEEQEPSESAAANTRAWQRMEACRPFLVGVRRAGDLVPDWPARALLHPGPALPAAPPPAALWEAATAALLAEGWADHAGEARTLLAQGSVQFVPSERWQAALPGLSLLTPSRPVWLVQDESGTRAFGPVWSKPPADEAARAEQQQLAAALDAALQDGRGLDLAQLVARGLALGEEGHGCGEAGAGLLLQQLLPALAAQMPAGIPARWIELLGKNPRLYLGLLLPMARLLAEAAALPDSTLVTAMGGNGQSFGLRVAGHWSLLDPAPPELAGLGDEPLLETIGLGGPALAAAPGLSWSWGIPPAEALRTTLEMYEITAGESQRWPIPLLAPRGLPLGINGWRVLESGIQPRLVCRAQSRLVEVPADLFRSILSPESPA